MLPNAQPLYHEYKKTLKKISDIKYASAVLQWDQETYLPEKGGDFRGQQIATLSEVSHNLFTDPAVGNLLKDLSQAAELTPTQHKNVLLSLEDHQKLTRYSAAFVREMSETISKTYHAWIKARKHNDFKIMQPVLTQLVALKQKETEIIGYAEHPYDALINEHERGMTVKQLDTIFTDVLAPLKDLLAKVRNTPQPSAGLLTQYFPHQQQWDWGMYLAAQLGFDFTAGRQDISEHPFTVNFNPHDVRITTRISENDFANMTWSTIHEVGHGLYEQGLPAEEYGLPLGEYASLGIHESQSRLYENCLGRGIHFWQYYYPVLQTYFPTQLAQVPLEQFYQAINQVQPSLIRTEADELTYHFHVYIRYELEKLLITGELNVADIPVYWNDQYKKYLGVDVPDDKQGCLQDVHWSHGSFGYFVTYSLGSFYAAQFWQQAQADIEGLTTSIASTGNTAPLLQWLRNNVHAFGRYYNSNELCSRATGTPLNSTVFINYLTAKLLGNPA